MHRAAVLLRRALALNAFYPAGSSAMILRVPWGSGARGGLRVVAYMSVTDQLYVRHLMNDALRANKDVVACDDPHRALARAWHDATAGTHFVARARSDPHRGDPASVCRLFSGAVMAADRAVVSVGARNGTPEAVAIATTGPGVTLGMLAAEAGVWMDEAGLEFLPPVYEWSYGKPLACYEVCDRVARA